MFTEDYYTRSGDNFLFSKRQGSDFAKRVAGDFNPLHDVNNSRFCVPGDLLFSVLLSKFGIRQEMHFDFQGMVGGNIPINFRPTAEGIVAENNKQKKVLSMTVSGDVTENNVFIEGLIRAYVAFSGKTFPHIIIELMKEKDAMINTRKPMVIYDQMQLSFERFSKVAPEVVLQNCQFDVTGKRGMVTMNFDLRAEGESIGCGEKQIIMSGLRPYEQSDIDYLVDTYNAGRQAFQQ
jgi:hypothetical protein